jgi:hypothetical protein
LAVILSNGMLWRQVETLPDVADGQGKPPAVVTGIDWLNVADELSLLQVPKIVLEPFGDQVTLQVWPSKFNVQSTPPGGKSRVAPPLLDVHKAKLPFLLLVVQVAEEVKPEVLTVHPVKIGGKSITMQTGFPEGEESISPSHVDAVQVIVDVPILKVTLDDEHNENVTGPSGTTVSADAAWTPRPSNAATNQVMRSCVVFIAVTPVCLGAALFTSGLDGSKDDHLTSLSLGRRGSSGLGTTLSASRD